MPNYYRIFLVIYRYNVSSKGGFLTDRLEENLRNGAIDIGFAAAGNHLIAQH